MTSQYDSLRALLQSWRDQLPYKGSQWEERHDYIKDCADELESALDELDETEDAHLVQNDGRDAARYRWLAENADIDSTYYDVIKLSFPCDPDRDGFNTLDEAIDAAMQVQP